jgi:hypothetical protein
LSMSNLKQNKMKNVILFLLVSLFTTPLLAESLTAEKSESFETLMPKRPSGFNYKKHHRRTRHVKLLNKLFDKNHCQNYKQGNH